MGYRFAITALAATTGIASANIVEVRVSVQNLAPSQSVSFAPLRVGFGAGAFDAFDINQNAGEEIISIAEGGSGADWFPAFAAAEPNATLGTVLPNPAGPLLPGQTGFADFTVNTSVNRFFTFGAMVVPSNDYFIGNDSPTAYELFSAQGDLLIGSISQYARDIWDAGSEVDGAFGAAFLVGSNNDDRIADDSAVEFDFDGLSIFNGLTTAAGYEFDSQLTADLEVYRITFEIIPAPGASAALAIAGLAGLRRRR